MSVFKLFKRNQKTGSTKLFYCKKAIISSSLLLFIALGNVSETKAQVCSNPTGWVGCSSTDFTNYGLNSTNNAATIEYDNIESGFHASVARQYDGTWMVWGEHMKSDGVSSVLNPQMINSTNYPGLTGTVLKAVIGGQDELTILTTTGLFVVGDDGQGNGNGVSSNLPAFGKINGLTNDNTYNLPSTLTPADVKMMLTTRGTFGIVTCSGAVWVVSNNTNICGAGNGATNTNTWYQVQTSSGVPLTNVVAVRTCNDAMIALTSANTLYTWGSYTFLGNNSNGATNRSYATLMTKPTLNSGATIKMVGATSNSTTNSATYYVLATDGNLYSMGAGAGAELGNFGTSDSKTWVQPRYSSTTTDVMNDIAWISPQEHDDTWSAINVINKGAHLWAWGNNSGAMLGGSGTGGFLDPFSPTSLSATDVVQAVVTGGHTSLIFRKCNTKFGYVGHLINGSMGNGVSASSSQTTYSFLTATQQVCGAPTNIVLTSLAATFCQSTAFIVNASPTGGTFSISTGNATISGSTVTPTSIGNIDVVYTTPSGSGCDVSVVDTNFIQKDFGNLNPATWPDAAASVLSTSSTRVWCGPNGDAPTTDCGTNTSDGQNNGLGYPSTVTALNTYTYTVTLNSNVSGTTGYYGLWFDWNGNGNFADDLDGNGNPAFYSGSAVSTAAGPVVVNVSVKVPKGASSNYAIRLIGGKSPITSTMYNSTSMINGEVEDYLKPTVLPVTLNSFTATKLGTTVSLNWLVSSEINVKNYSVEFSKDGINFTTIGSVSASNSPNYNFVHNSPTSGLNYYRLKMIDIDGTYSYSNICIANFNGGDAVIVYPNPTKGIVSIAFTSSMVNKPATLKVSSIDGKVLMLQKASTTNQTQTLDLTRLPSGKYLISIITDTDVTNKMIDVLK